MPIARFDLGHGLTAHQLTMKSRGGLRHQFLLFFQGNRIGVTPWRSSEQAAVACLQELITARDARAEAQIGYLKAFQGACRQVLREGLTDSPEALPPLGHTIPELPAGELSGDVTLPGKKK